MEAKKTKSRMGRPPKIIDWKKVESLCQIHCTESEIASVMEIHIDTLYDKCKKEYGLTFPEYYKKHCEGGKMSLRRAQFKKAVVDGNPALQIWLGKQILGQKDHVDFSTAQPIILGYDPKDI
jgi:hypothetical protein